MIVTALLSLNCEYTLQGSVLLWVYGFFFDVFGRLNQINLLIFLTLEMEKLYILSQSCSTHFINLRFLTQLVEENARFFI